jgi:hypothetical protein
MGLTVQQHRHRASHAHLDDEHDAPQLRRLKFRSRNRGEKAMPRYFFNTRIGDEIIPDPEGENLRDPDHAWEVARAMIVELLEEQGEHPNILTAALIVTDRNGDVVMEFPFSEAIVGQEGPSGTRH